MNEVEHPSPRPSPLRGAREKRSPHPGTIQRGIHEMMVGISPEQPKLFPLLGERVRVRGERDELKHETSEHKIYAAR